MVDLNLLRLMRVREDFNKLNMRVPTEHLDVTTRNLLKVYAEFFKQDTDAAEISKATLRTMFYARNPNIKKEDKSVYDTLINKVSEPVSDADRRVLLRTLLQLRLSTKLTSILTHYEEGEVSDLHAALELAVSNYQRDADVTGIDFVHVDPEELLTRDENNEGLRWRLQCLTDHVRPLRGGDFGIVAARPDRGKTSFLASELTHMAAGTDRNIVWFNNEGPGDRIYSRLWSAALGVGVNELIAKHRANGSMIREYMQAIKGNHDKIRVYDIHGHDSFTVQELVEREQPALVVYDMIDNIRFDAGSSARTDERLEQMYQWGRELGVRYDFAAMATSQISGDGDGMQFPEQHMLKDSKTGKQGACDFILMIGSSNDPSYARTRFISLPKNKLAVQGSGGNPRCPVSFVPEFARFEDISGDLSSGMEDDASDDASMEGE